MLVMAIIIIIQAPRCAPKETLEWVQESAMIQYDLSNPVDANGDGTETPEGEWVNDFREIEAEIAAFKCTLHFT